MKTRTIFKPILVVPIVALLVIAVAGVCAYLLIPRSVSAEIPSTTPTFEFESSKASGWFAGNSIDGETTNADAAPTSKKLPTTMRIMAQGTVEKPTGNCFVMYSYWANNAKDVNQTLNELSASSDPSTQGTFTLQPHGTTKQQMNSSNGTVTFDLHRYDITGPDTSGMSTGKEIAVFKSGTGYIDVQGYCKTVDELDVTLPLFDAVSFKE